MNQLVDDFQLSEDDSIVKKKRPTFLLVLFILTCAATGFGLIMGLINLTGFNDIESQLRNASAGSNPFSDEVLGSMDIEGMQSAQDFSTILSIVANILCFVGALIMFKMRKIGFLPYVLGQCVAIYGTYVGLGILDKMAVIMPVKAAADIMQITGVVTMVVMIIFAIAFIIMYGVNLKHLK